MAEENRASSSTTVTSVGLKLPPFWPEQPTIWFAQTEAQFAIKNISVELTKFYHVVAALDGSTAQRVSDILEIPPRENPYNILKKRLTNAFALSDRERAAQILDLNDLVDRKPSALMDHLLGLVGDRSSEFLMREVFLRSLPDKISIVVAASTSGLRELALEADRHFATSGLVCSSLLPSRLSTKVMSRHRKYTHRSDLDARHATVNLHKLACVTITPRLVQQPAIAVRHVRGCRLAISHAFRETPCQRPLVNTAAGHPSKLFRVHDSQSGESHLVDTGAEISLLPPTDYDRKFRTRGSPLPAANGTDIASFGERTKSLKRFVGISMSLMSRNVS